MSASAASSTPTAPSEGEDMAKRNQTSSNISFCKQLKASIADEKSAVPDYQGLMRNACSQKMRCKSFKPAITAIIRDEKRHRRRLETLYDRHCR